MLTVQVFGVGALGSHFCDELARWCHSKEYWVRFHLYDYDEVEDRNCASQLYLPEHIGQLKVEAMKRHLSSYKKLPVSVYPGKVVGIEDIVRNSPEIWVDALDNLPTRQSICTFGQTHGIPVLHGGLSMGNYGLVTWSLPDYDNFPLSPRNLSKKEGDVILNTPQESLPPCELVEMRGVINNTSRAMVLAFWNAMGLYVDAPPALKSYTTENTSIEELTTVPLEHPIISTISEE